MPLDSITNELLDFVTCLWVLAQLRSFPDDILEESAGHDERSADRVYLAVSLIAGDQAIMLVPHDKAVRHRLDGVVQRFTGIHAFRLDTLTLAHCRVERACESQHEQPCRGDDNEQAIA